MNYEVVKPHNAPSWFTPGIKCKVWDNGRFFGEKETLVIVWYEHNNEFPFVDKYGNRWQSAEPIEVWIPKVGEPVACWDGIDSFYRVFAFNVNSVGGEMNTSAYYSNIVKYDGQRDMRVEVLKDAPRFK